MKNLSTTIALCGLAFCMLALAPIVDATAQDNNATVTVKGNTAQRHVYISPNEFREIGGRYLLENGKTLSFTRSQNRFYVEISGVSSAEVKPLAPDLFVSADNEIKLRFLPADYNNEVQVVVTYTERR